MLLQLLLEKSVHSLCFIKKKMEENQDEASVFPEISVSFQYEMALNWMFLFPQSLFLPPPADIAISAAYQDNYGYKNHKL